MILAPDAGTAANTGNITIVLQSPKYAGNVGSIARTARNMDINGMIVVRGEPLEEADMKQMSTHFAADLIDHISYFDTLKEALADFEYVVGTTARKGHARGPLISPKEAARRVADMSQMNRVALLFGPEDTGLSNDDLRYCHAVATIPTSQKFKSINLSHAVMILCYEIFVARMPAAEKFSPRLAQSAELEGMYDQVKAMLTKIGFLNPENPDYWMMHLRRLFSRTALYSKEVKIIRGICRQIDWYFENKKA
ncbi:MAG: RNA methyltransferase [Deltaproteobacteria bacterium]|nr:RNA methyltransferase [Deltaproteobacteria bacterium]